MIKYKNSRSLSNEFIRLAENDGMRIRNLNLQCLSYITQGWSLALLKRSLIKDIPQARPYGPIYPDLYQALRRYGSGNIMEEIRENDMHASAFIDVKGRGRGNIIHYNWAMEEYKLINAVWRNYKIYSSSQCMELICSDKKSPWAKAYNKHGDCAPITNDMLYSYYSNMV